jgi:hypothetical protein
MIRSNTRITLAAGKPKSTSMDKISRFKSSTTLKGSESTPTHQCIAHKSIDQQWLAAAGTINGSGFRAGKRRFPLRRSFKFSSQ